MTFHAARTRKYTVLGRGSTVVDTLEMAWEALRSVVPSIPQAVLTLVDRQSRGRVRGYFAHSTWKKRGGSAHEIAISPSLIGNHPELLATMLHEAAHAILFEKGHRGGIGASVYYHTKVFRDQCSQLGLSCEFKDTQYGWNLTSWPASVVPERFAPIIALLRANLPAGTGGRRVGRSVAKKLPRPGHTMLICRCGAENRTVYVKKSMLDAGGILCSFCGHEFRPAGSAR